MSNLYYEQLERECDPELLHLHLNRNETILIYKALHEYVFNHAVIPNEETKSLNKLNHDLVSFFTIKNIIPESVYDELIEQLEHERIMLEIARGSDYSGVIALKNAIKIIRGD